MCHFEVPQKMVLYLSMYSVYLLYNYVLMVSKFCDLSFKLIHDFVCHEGLK